MNSTDSKFSITACEYGFIVAQATSKEMIANAPVDDYEEILNGVSVRLTPTRLLLRYLPAQLTVEKLTEICSQFGTLKEPATIVMNPISGKKCGYGFVAFDTVESTNQARLALLGKELYGNRIIAQVAYEHDKQTRRACLHLEGLNINWTPEEVYDEFRFLGGQVMSTKILLDPITGVSRGIGFVRFLSKMHAAHVLYTRDGYVPVGETQPVKITWAKYGKGGEHMPDSEPFSEPFSQPVSEPLSQPGSEPVSGASGTGISIFVGNIGKAFTEDSLKAEGAKYGNVISAAITVAGGNNGGGYGFLNMADINGAMDVIANMNGKKFPGGGVLSVSRKR